MNIKELFFNFFLLLSATVFANLINLSRLKDKRLKSVILGLIFGLISIVGMLFPVKLTEGLIFDGRSIILSLASLFYGPVCGIVSGFFAAIFRIYIGGSGAIVGILVIFESVLVGSFFNYLILKQKLKLSNNVIVLVSFIVHILMYILMFLLPVNYKEIVLSQLRIAMLIIYPSVGILIGKIFWLQIQFQESTEKIKLSEEKFSSIFHKTVVPFLLIEKRTKTIVDVNEYFLKFFGYSKEEIIKKRIDEINLFDRKDLENFIVKRLDELGLIKNIEIKAFTKSNQSIDVLLNAEKYIFNGLEYSLLSFYDLSGQKKSIKEIFKLTQIFSLLSEINQLIVRTKDKEELLSNICEISVREGNFKFVWIGEIDQKNKIIKKSYSAGKISLEFENFHFNLTDEFSHHNPIAQCFLTGKHKIINYSHENLSLDEFHSYIVNLGIKSSASFPIKVFDQITHIVSYYSTEENFFDSAEIELLVEVSKDISYALEFIDNEEKRRKAESNLKENLRFLQTLINNLPGFIYRCLNDRDWTMEYLTHQVEDITGYKPEDLIHNRVLTFNDIIHPDFRDLLWEKWQKILSEKSVFEHEYKIITKSGEIKWVWERGRGIYNEKGEVIALEGFITDVTDKVNFRQQLIESNEKLRLLVEGTPYFFFYTHDKEGRITYISPSVEKITGYKVEEWVGTNHWFLTDNPINEKARINTRKALKGEKAEFPIYIEIFHKNGNKIILEIYEVPSYKNDKIVGLHGIARDVTTEKKIHDKLIKSEERFRKLFFEHSAVKLIINPITGKIFDANKSAVQFYGYTVDELKEMKIEDIQDSKLEKIETSGEHYKNFYEAKHKLKDGTIKNVVVFLSRVEIEGEEYLHLIIHDITESKKFEKDLLFEKTKFQQLFDNSPIAIAIIDRQEKIQIDNRQFKKFFDFHNDEEIGKNFIEICFLDEMESIHKNFFQRIYKGEKLIQETYLKKKDGTLAYVQLIGVPIFLDNEIVGIFVLIVDITKIKEAEEDMKAAKEMAEMASKIKDTFIANISHEIRTPLNSILGYSELIREAVENLLSENEKIYFSIIRSAGNRLMRTIEMIMNYSRITVGDFPIKKQKLNLTKLIQTLYQEFYHSAKLKNLEFVFNNECGEVFILSDNYCITQAIANLVDNAIKYTKQGSVIINLKRDDQNKLIMEIKDTGIGISKMFQDRLFEPYSQQELGWNRPYEGVGLGLALVKRYLGLIGMDISFQSKEGIGSTFYIHFNDTEIIE